MPLATVLCEWNVCFPGSVTHGQEERRVEEEMGSAEVVFVMVCTGPSVIAPADSVTDFTHLVDSRASPRQEGGDPLTSDGCLNIIPLEQAEQEEMKVFTRMGTALRPALPPDDREKGLAVEVALSEGRALDKEHLTHLFGLSSSLQGLICLQVMQLLAPPLLWVPNREASRSPFSPFYLSTEHTSQGLIYI